MNRLHSKKGASPVSLIAVAVVITLAAFVLSLCVFTVDEWEQAVVTQFGEVVDEPITEAGLKFKMPWQAVRKFDRRLLRWDGSETTTITRDRRTINIDVTARWRITDARRFLETIGSINQADARLNGIIAGAVKDEIAKFELYEVVRSSNRILDTERTLMPNQITDQIGDEIAEQLERDDLATLGATLPRLRQDTEGVYQAGRPIVLDNILREAQRRLVQINLGIQVEDVLIKQLGYIREIEANVYAQMNAELEKIAAGFRSSGRQLAEERLGEMQRELAIIESSAVERAQRIRGEGEAQSIRIYAEAYNQDPEFYRLIRSLEAYEKMMRENSTLVITTQSPLYRILKSLEEDF